MISIIAAMSNSRVIGKNNKMPWHLPADLKHFKSVTLGKPIIMGRKTFESIGKALPGRRNMVITRQEREFPDCEVFHSLEAALDAVAMEPEVMIIGGANVYAQVLPKVQRMYLTFIDIDVDGDAFFPAWDKSIWQEVSSEAHDPDDKNPYAYRFVVLDRMDK